MTPPKTSSVEHFISLLARLSRLVNHDGHASGLKPAQWDALRFLARANRFSRTPGGLTAYLGATKGTTSQTLMSLEKKGLVEKNPDPLDRRSVALKLTAAGEELAQSDALSSFGSLFEALSPPERQSLEVAMEQLLRAKLQQQGNRPFGICNSCRHFRKNSPDGKLSAGQPHFCSLLKEPLSDHDSHKICIEQEAA
ncbi:MarR family winged helix-turn-helix transcriptional regulator [Kiloniella laminariae]|uniref:MarR family winged helix-turn-helix transcriptional regulator n=1 Tax=Kiloniella laminariae TaxID=454162 RepID=A0ABT4LEZ4_9PROT|nr:MarR family winged helix-turn-helix transcriptional regulator [Kiloniella laminariae]MCZ4279665.1 MarR family winged helix-turn-helix transcriptional regulator [Kiloniella laminariae]